VLFFPVKFTSFLDTTRWIAVYCNCCKCNQWDQNFSQLFMPESYPPVHFCS